MTARKRIRTAPCCIPGCDAWMPRGDLMPLCTDHMLRVWRLIDSERQRFGAIPLPDRLPDDSAHVATESELKAAEHAHRIKSRPSHAQEGTIYVLDTGVQDGVKIGWTSRDVYRRLAEYPPTFRTIVTAPGTRADERDLHRSLKLFRMEGMGNEWYHADNGEVVRAINDLIRLSNVVHQQRTGRAVERASDADALMFDRTWGVKWRFVSLDKWRGDQPAVNPTTMPGPKSRPAAYPIR